MKKREIKMFCRELKTMRNPTIINNTNNQEIISKMKAINSN